jgi:solute carrier family 25 oxoglutarate transporter 11
MGDEKKPKPVAAGFWPTIKPFVNGGASGMLATCVIQPIDMIKVIFKKVFIFHLNWYLGLF